MEQNNIIKMDPRPLYSSIMFGMAAVLQITRNMHQELADQISALPLGEEREQILECLQEHATQITEEGIVERLWQLFPETDSRELLRAAVSMIDKPEDTLKGDYALPPVLDLVDQPDELREEFPEKGGAHVR